MSLSLTDFPAGLGDTLRTDHEGVDSLTQGVAQYQALGVPPAKLVTIFAWFGMDVQCTNTSGACALEYPHCCKCSRSLRVFFPKPQRSGCTAASTASLIATWKA